MACIENRKLVLVGGKNGSNQKMSENKKFLIISVNLNPKCQVPNPKIAFYQNTLVIEYFFIIDNLNFELSRSIESSLRSLSTL